MAQVPLGVSLRACLPRLGTQGGAFRSACAQLPEGSWRLPRVDALAMFPPAADSFATFLPALGIFCVFIFTSLVGVEDSHSVVLVSLWPMTNKLQ